MLNFLRNNELVKSKEDAIALLNSSSVMDIAGDGTLIEARYSDGDKIKTIFALYHISGDSKTATIYDSEAHIAPDAKINEKITNIIDRLDKVDGGSSGSGTPGEPSLIDKVTNLIESVGDKNNLVTTDKTNLVNAINETFKKVGTIPVLVEAQLRRDGDYNVDQTTGTITNNASFTPSENDKEGLVITFLSKGSNDKPQVKSVFIDFEKIFIESEVGDGLKVDTNHKINVNIDDNSEKYLSVSSNGLKFTGLDAEIQNRKDADTALGERIDTETEERKTADSALDGKITTEVTERKKSDKELDRKIDAEIKNREDADKELDGKITTKINTLQNTIEKEIETATGSIDLSGYVKKGDLSNDYYKKSQVDDKLGEKVDNTELTKYLTTTDAASTYQPKGDYVTKDDLGEKADKSELEKYQTISDADKKYPTKKDLSDGYYDKNSIDTKLGNIEQEIKTATENIDLTNYVTNETLTKNYQTTSVADGKYATKKELSGSYYNKTYIDTELDKKADKTELTSAQEELEKKIKASQGSVLVDAKLTSNKYTISQTDGKINTTSTPLPEGGEEIVLLLKMPQSDGSVKYESIAVNVEQLLLENEAGDGIKVDNHVFGVKIDPKNEGRFLSVGKNGLKFSGLLEMEEVVAASLNDLNTRIKVFESGPESVSRKFSELLAKIEQLEAKIAKP